MEDSASQSMSEVEVYWDCGSPTPTAWRKYQVPCSSEKILYQGIAPSTSTCMQTKQRSKLGLFQVDKKCYEKAQKLIEEMKRCNDVSESDESKSKSIEYIFNMSGREEELPQTITLNCVGSCESQREIIHAENDLPVDPDFWNDDLFIDEQSEPQSKTTSTPVSNDLKRGSLKKKPTEKTFSLEAAEIEDSSSVMCGIVPMTSHGNKSDVDEINDDIFTAHACAEFFMSFELPSKRNLSRKKLNKSRNVHEGAIDCDSSLHPVKRNTARNILLKSEQSETAESKLGRVQSSPIVCSLATSFPSSTIPTNIHGISEEILSQLMMDESWPETPPKTSNVASMLQGVKESIPDNTRGCDISITTNNTNKPHNIERVQGDLSKSNDSHKNRRSFYPRHVTTSVSPSKLTRDTSNVREGIRSNKSQHVCSVAEIERKRQEAKRKLERKNLFK